MVTRERIVSTDHIVWPHERPLPEITEPLPAGTRLVSADSHWLEPDAFVDKMPAKFRDRAPRGHFTDEGGYHFEIDGKTTDNPILPSQLIEGRAGMWDADVRLAEISKEGVEKELLFPQRMLGAVRNEDKEYVQAAFDAYNELLAEFCAQQPEHFYGIGLINYWDPDATRDEVQKIKALGFKAIQMPTLPPGVYYNSRKLEGMWDALEEGGIPISFHVGETFDARGLGGLATTIVVAFQPYRRLFSLLAFSGILERHPELSVVFTEGGIAWVPSCLFDCDKVYAGFESEMNPKLANKPSHYWFQNCYATFMEDPPGLQQLDLIGWDRVLWSSDYPHPESTVGYTQQTVRDVFDATGDVQKAQAIVGGTAIKLWGLDD